MKIATYNIWNDTSNIEKRVELLINEINNYDIDFLALQEVKDESTFQHIKKHTNFQYGMYFNELGVLSKFPLINDITYNENNCYIQRVIINNVAFTNVHLDYEFKENRAKAIDKIYEFIDTNTCDTEIILGDFNEDPDEMIHFDLILDGFHDLHKEYCHNENLIPEPTLDFDNNPRWRINKTEETPVRFDWIMLYSEDTFHVKKASIIGKEETNGITPSDHYGVLIDIDL